MLINARQKHSKMTLFGKLHYSMKQQLSVIMMVARLNPSKDKFRGTIMKHFSNVKTKETERSGSTLTVKQNPKISGQCKREMHLGGEQNRTD